MSIAENLKRLRHSSGLTLQQLADRVGASKTRLSELERGTTENPGLDLLRSLAATFEVSVASLIGEDPGKQLPPPVQTQVENWARMIMKELARGSGMDVDTAAREARVLFEGVVGPLDEQHEANWLAAIEQVSSTLNQPVEYLGSNSLRKPRRPQWYSGPKAGDAIWPAYQAHLLSNKAWFKSTVSSIDATSTEVVSLMENPAQTSFRGRGLVVGYVQSGKTANMMGVISKAVDAGYKIVVILTGLTNSLRAQTQGRFTEDLEERNRYAWYTHTTAEQDFRKPPSKWFAPMEPVQIAIVKKNVSPLKALLQTLEKTPPTLLGSMPVLLIDDECDQASVNATGTEFSMTAINRLIRKILAKLPRAQYVGYTATPFANVLINPKTQAGLLDDLYPEDFITALPKPDGYFGPESLFGRDPIDAEDEAPEESGLDMIRAVPNGDVQFVRPPNQKSRESFEPSVPESLDEALSYFVLATACRYTRGDQDQHSSMLIHTTVYTIPHHKQAAVIAEWRDRLLSNVRAGDGDTLTRLRELWEKESGRVGPARFGNQPVSFAELLPHLPPVLQDIEIIVENGISDTRLDFSRKGRKYIVVGGSVLARGLTIEGLSVSYFVRTSSQYDTLLQMGRWFGYRFGYEDLPRIWMTDDLAQAFRDLATVEAEIRSDILEYRKRDVTPADFAVRIRQIPRMTITAAKKMMFSESCDVSFSGEHIQTIRFAHTDKTILNENWAAGAALVDAAAATAAVETRSGGRLFKGVPLEAVLRFLKTYKGSEKDLLSGHLLDYIETEAARDDKPFAEWNVGVIEPGAGKSSQEELGALGAVTLVRRARLKMQRADGLADIKALMSRRDVLLDVDADAGNLGWTDLKAKRQAVLGDRVPLLLLYGIDAVSEAAEGSETRVALNAVRDVLGLGLVLPDRGQRTAYVRVKLEQEEGEEENLAAELPKMDRDDETAE